MIYSLSEFSEEVINRFYPSYDECFIGTLKDFQKRRFNIGMISGTSGFDTFEEAKKDLIEYWEEKAKHANDALDRAKKIKCKKTNL